MPGGRKCVATAPTVSPPRASSVALRSKPARTALRTLMSSNGAALVFSAASGHRRSRPARAGRALGDGLLEHGRGQQVVAGDHVLAGEHAARGRHRVVVALRHRDLVQVGGAEVGLGVPARVADELDRRAGLVLADHVRAGRDLLGAVAGDLLAVERERVLARDGSGQRQHERRGERAAGRAVELEDQRPLVRRGDAVDRRVPRRRRAARRRRRRSTRARTGC